MSSKPAWATKQASRWPERQNNDNNNNYWLYFTLSPAWTTQRVQASYEYTVSSLSPRWGSGVWVGGEGGWRGTERQCERDRLPDTERVSTSHLEYTTGLLLAEKRLPWNHFVRSVSHVIHCLVDFPVCKILIVLWFQIYHTHTHSHTLKTQAHRHTGTYWYIPMPAPHKNKRSIRW